MSGALRCACLIFVIKVKKAHIMKKGFPQETFLLGYPDSNQKRQDQNLQCYHYTIPQSLFAMTICLIAGAKLVLFL